MGYFFICLYVCIDVFMCPRARCRCYMVALGLVEVRGKEGGCVCLEWLVHGQVCSQSCVGKRHITKSEFWFLFQFIFV